MKLIEDMQKSRSLIEQCILRHGSSPEHNYCHYMNIEDAGSKNIFISFGENKGILAQHFQSINEWVMLGDVLAPEEERASLLFEAAGSCPGKFVIEAKEEFRRQVIEHAGKHGFSVSEPRFILYWPVFELEKWNGNLLERGVWKKLRNIRNKFMKCNKFEVADSKSIPKEQLRKLIMDWVGNRRQSGIDADRRSNNKSFYERYLKLVESGFEGVKFAKTVVIDGKPCSITAGWEIPNSGNSYYSAIGVYGYNHEGLGEFANLEDLSLLKKEGYKLADFGGSPKSLLEFKMKFKPTTIYKTYTFSIKK